MILVFGKTGQVASELAKHPEVECLGRDRADLSDPAACAATIRTMLPNAVINAAAYTAVDKAEEEEELATVINAEAPAAMAQACSILGIPFVTISTDYVFSGDGTTPWAHDDVTGPLGAYGRSKLAGERAVQKIGGRFAVLRTSWVVSAHGNNFVKTMLRLAETRDNLTVVADQIGGPTAARDIATACISIAMALESEAQKSGVYHYASTPDTSWADFARAIFEQAGVDCQVSDIPSSAYPTTAVRPLNSRLDCESTNTAFGLGRPDWRVSLTEILDDLKQR
ncbi:MAG: dTDP-4-dehydrorhamnose reductase [Paracoccaceae bacterium]